ncbi:MAG: RNA polymerase sigma factor [Myxococcota bacterium]
MAGSRILERYYPRIRRFFQNKAASASDELTQQVFLGCARNLHTLRSTTPSSFRAFLFRIAHHRLIDHYRSRSRSPIDFSLISAVALDPSPSRLVARREEEQLLLDALRQIPVEYQIVLELFYWESMTAAEISEIVGIPLGTAKTRLRRGKQLLAEQIEALNTQPAVRERTITNLQVWADNIKQHIQKK